MPSAFVPFLPADRTTAAPTLDVPAQGDSPTGAASFAALLPTGGKPNSDPNPTAPHHPKAPGHQPVVTLQKEGERITGIRVQCSCGEIIDLDCSY